MEINEKLSNKILPVSECGRINLSSHGSGRMNSQETDDF